MPDTLEQLHGTAVLVCAADGPQVRGEGDALQLIVEAGQRDASWVAVPASRLSADFFQLRTGLAGAIMQKFVNYRMRLAVVGDISEHTETSGALRDLVRESNRGRQIWFVSDLDDLRARLQSSLPAGW